MERKRIPWSTKLGIAAAGFFIGGAASMGIGVYRIEQNTGEIHDAQNKIFSNLNLTEEERAALISEIPEKDTEAQWIATIGALSIFYSAILGISAGSEADMDKFNKWLDNKPRPRQNLQ